MKPVIFHPSIHDAYFGKRDTPARLTFECRECGHVSWHQAYIFADDVVIKSCKPCGTQTHQNRFHPKPLQN